MLQEKKLIEQSRRIIQVYEDLLNMGMSNKDISSVLGMYPSAFSNFINRVLKKIVHLDEKAGNNNHKIQDIFEQVNNISELKTRQRMGKYLERLEILRTNPHQGLSAKEKRSTEHSQMDIYKMLEGTYYCYYLSTFGYKIKKEPFLIQKNPQEQSYLIKKGNQLGTSSYEGLGFILKSHIFSVQLSEIDGLIQDSFIVQFQLPPFYTSSMNLFKGISLSLSNSFLPISRKLILHRYSSEVDEDQFNTIETVFFDKEDTTKDDIVRYLRKEISYLEYVPIPHPNYDLSDLAAEERLKKLLSL